MALQLPTHRTFGNKQLVKDASHKRRHNVPVQDDIQVRVAAVVRTRDSRKRNRDATSQTQGTQPTIIVAATVQQLAIAAGAQGENQQ